ncbi:MAG: hypothetical protein ACO1OB_02520 [Archangium sp.]
MKRALLTLAALLALAGCPPTVAQPDGGGHTHDDDAGVATDAGVVTDAGIPDAGTDDAGVESALEADLLPPTAFPPDLLPPGDGLPAALIPPKQ